MKQQQLNDELTIIGLIFTILVLTPLIYFSFTGLKQELYLAKSLVGAYHLLSQSLLIPNLNPIGLTF